MCFLFQDHWLNGTKNALVVEVPDCFAEREQLFEYLRKQLRFPYFGGTWDALYDLLCDLSWLEEEKVVLMHKSIPLARCDQMLAYLHLLRDAVKTWRGQGTPRLVVIFPLECRSLVTWALNSRRIDSDS